jgi:lysyl-tRNA synthetase class 2
MNHHWQPAASFEMLHKRAAILAKIRAFFAERGVLEVETPLLCETTVPDPYILSIPAEVRDPRLSQTKTCYLQTSPEYAMKRLLAAGSGSIYQLCKAFRQDELGRLHNPEFTILEWYRLDFDHHALMNEVDELFKGVMQTPPAERLSYAEAFDNFLGLNPHTAEKEELEACARHQAGIEMQGELSRDGWLNLLMSHCIEPHLGQKQPAFIYDFPASQAALARLRPGKPPLASRFEVYYQGIELGNGFHELQASEEQRSRFVRDLDFRAEHKIPLVPLDERLLAALSHGLPDCSGIAIGIDRLIMLALGCKAIEEVLSFNFAQA